MISDFQWVLVGIAVLIIVLVIVYNRWQEAKYKKLAEHAFSSNHRDVLLHEALPNIAIPFITTFGAQFTLMIIGTIVVERVFGLNGVGAFFIEAIRFRDFIGMQAVLTLFVVFFVSANLLVDLIAMLADPLLRRARRA